jgi:hypothetical protein
MLSFTFHVFDSQTEVRRVQTLLSDALRIAVSVIAVLVLYLALLWYLIGLRCLSSWSFC